MEWLSVSVAPTRFAELCQFSDTPIDASRCRYPPPRRTGESSHRRISGRRNPRRTQGNAAYCVFVPAGAWTALPAGASAALGSGAGLSDFEFR